MRSNVLLTAVCLFGGHATRKTLAFAPCLQSTAGKPGVDDVSSSTTRLDLFRPGPRKTRTITRDNEVDEFDRDFLIGPPQRNAVFRNRVRPRRLASRIVRRRRGDRPGRLKKKKDDSASSVFRSAIVMDADGNLVRLGESMGEGTSVVVFLRHLGDPYCWSYVKDWCKLQRKIRRTGATGPLFISIGDSDKLNKFLKLNRRVPRKQAFVDNDDDVRTYRSVGLGTMRLGDDMPQAAAPQLGGVRGWWKYARNVIELSPMEPGAKEFSKGLKALGGTFVVDGDDVIYEWKDKFPGDNPAPDDVLEVVIKSSP